MNKINEHDSHSGHASLRRCVHHMQVDEKFVYKNLEMHTNEKK